ncbi:hypothetical protein Mrose_01190 [Calidithermus roseus]|uniref:Uncharacterized protein n=1 Tax=Calidithermus roseus TaxID=1644118 RepID=A0A399EVY4_9DEIN|nr:hypothetical protein Mrose_01190 [Calidithermus roseus]
MRLPRGFEVPAYTFVQAGSGAHAALWANIWHKTYGGSYYWLTDPEVIWGASAPWEAERFTKKKNRES